MSGGRDSEYKKLLLRQEDYPGPRPYVGDHEKCID